MLKPRLEVRGAGQMASRLLPAQSMARKSLFTLAFGTVTDGNLEIRDLEIDCETTPEIVGIELAKASSISAHDIIFTGCAYNITVDQGNLLSFRGLLSRGTPAHKSGSLRVVSSDPRNYVANVSIMDYFARNIGNGFHDCLILIERGVDVRIIGLDCNDAVKGGAVRGIVFVGDCQGCKVTSSLIGAASAGIQLDAAKVVASGRDVMTAPSFLSITDCDIDQPVQAGILIGQASHVTISGGHFTSSGVSAKACGILVNRGEGIAISGVRCHGFSAGNGVLIGEGQNDISVTGCHVVARGTGIGVVGNNGANSGLIITGNDLRANTTPLQVSLADKGAGPVKANSIRFNLGAPDHTPTP